MRTPARPQFRPLLDTLGDRSLLSVTLTNGLLEVIGTTGADSIHVTQPTPAQVRVTVDNTGEGGTFPAEALSRVLVRSRGGDDTVAVAANFSRPVEVRAWAGNDTITGGPLGDTLLGGGGNDVITGNGGGDTIIGQAGDDRCYGNGGADTLYGDTPAALPAGGLDYLVGGEGDDRLFGGLFDDTFVIGLGFDDVDGGSGVDHYLTQGLNDPSPVPFTTDYGLPLLGNDFWDGLDLGLFSGIGVGGTGLGGDPWGWSAGGGSGTGWAGGYDPFGGFDPYADPFGGVDPYDPFGGTGFASWDGWLDDLYTTNFGNPFGNHAVSSYPGWAGSLDPNFFDSLGWDSYFLGDVYRPVQTVSNGTVLATGQTASSVRNYDDGYRIRTFDNLYQTGTGWDTGSSSGGADIAPDWEVGKLEVGTLEMPGTIDLPDPIELPVW